MDLLDGCFATSSSQLPNPKPCAAVPAAWLFCFFVFVNAQKHSLRSFVYSTHLYFEASFKSSFIS
jgi:hypothetical protein